MRNLFFKRGDIVQVLTTEPVNEGLLDYIVPIVPNGIIQIGNFVEVPILSRTCVGVVWGYGSSEVKRKKVKTIIRVLEIEPMNEELRKFLFEVANYNVSPLNKVFRLCLGAQRFLEPGVIKKRYYVGNANLERSTPKRIKTVEFLASAPEKKYSMSELISHLGVSPSLVKKLVQQGNIRFCYQKESTRYELCEPIFSKNLSQEQFQISKQLRSLIKAQIYSTSLLRGITGSGKTEVYLDSVSEALSLGKQVLVLVPEIALSVDFVQRVFNRFGIMPGQWHSGIAKKDRKSLYGAVASGKANLVIGARSALFLPFKNLGLIVVDEEHDVSYKQDDVVCYNARDMAVLRASMNSAQVILASATPSLETWANAKSGKYTRFDLWVRYGEAVLPEIEVVDLRNQSGQKKGEFISEILKAEIRQRIKRGEQSLLFLNRRGYAPITVCNSCGFQIACRKCDAKLVYHKYNEKLICHQCGGKSVVPTSCPRCNTDGRLISVGPGIERLEEECIKAFPNSKIGVLSSDSADNVFQLRKKFDEFKTGDIDIIIGTQLVSKGHNFPKITLVGVIDADLGLQGSDLRAAEKTFQLLRQVSGRAGRKNILGKALIQTHCPDHPVILAISEGKDDDFWNLEATVRQHAGSPPFGRMIALILSGTNEKQLFNFGRKLTNNWQELNFRDTIIYGPSFAPISRIRNRFRVRLLVKAKKNKNVQAMMRLLIKKTSLPRSVKITVDVDPQNFY